MGGSGTPAGVRGAHIDEGAESLEQAVRASEFEHLPCRDSPPPRLVVPRSLLARKSLMKSSTLAMRLLRRRLPVCAGDNFLASPN